jgi:hypothetical protein
MSTQSISVSFYLPVQIALLVLFYGNILPTLPIWLVWAPSLIIVGLLVIAAVILLVALIAAFFSN